MKEYVVAVLVITLYLGLCGVFVAYGHPYIGFALALCISFKVSTK